MQNESCMAVTDGDSEHRYFWRLLSLLSRLNQLST